MSPKLLESATYFHAASVCHRLVGEMTRDGNKETAAAIRHERDDARKAGLAAYADHLATEVQP